MRRSSDRYDSSRKQRSDTSSESGSHARSSTPGKSGRSKAGAESPVREPAVANIIAAGESAIAKVVTIPSKSVTFYPNEKRQQTYIVIANNSDRKVMFKMKSTRPGVYKMKPVFGGVNAGEKFSVRLTYMGIKIGNRIPLNDRITIVLASVAPKHGEADLNTAAQSTEGEMRKRRIYILYKGINDDKDPEAEEEAKKKPAVKTPVQGAKPAVNQQAYMNGYDEGYKAALIESRESKGSADPAEALKRLQESKGIGKEPGFQEGFIEGYKKATALLQTTEKKVVKEEKLTPKEEKPVPKEEKPAPKEERPAPKEEKPAPKEAKPKPPPKEPTKATPKESDASKERQKTRSGGKSKGKKPSKKTAKAPSKEKPAKGKKGKTPKKVAKAAKEPTKGTPKERAKEPAKKPAKEEPVKAVSDKLVKVKAPSEEVAKESLKKQAKEPAKPPKEPEKVVAEAAKTPIKEREKVKEEVKKEEKVELKRKEDLKEEKVVKVEKEVREELVREAKVEKAEKAVREEVKMVEKIGKVEMEVKEKSKKEEKAEKETKLTDGRNVMAMTPGGTDPSLGDPLKRRDIVHIGRTGKRQIVIVMYRDPRLPENLLSRSGDEEDEDDDKGSSEQPIPPRAK